LVAEALVARDAQVTVFNRGRRRESLPFGVRHLSGDRTLDEDLRLVSRTPWDAVIDISGKIPAVVQRSVAALADVTALYVSVSTVRAYRDWPGAPVDERSPLLDSDLRADRGGAKDVDEYGWLKAGCEQVCLDAVGGDRLLILRLHDVVGQYEDPGPLLWWCDRMRRGGPILVPAPDRAIQPIDVHDVAAFTVSTVQRGEPGVFNVAAPADGRTYGGMVQACSEVVGHAAAAEAELVWVDERWLIEQGVAQWTELPLWRAAPAAWNVDVKRAVAAGLRCRPLIDTVTETWLGFDAGERSPNHQRVAKYGMDPARESDLLARWRAR
jgi:hypothetical protein